MTAAPVRVLLVEDEPFTRAVLAETIASWGYEVSAAAGAAQAIRIANERLPQIVVTDLELPGGPSGLDVLRLLRTRDPWLPAIILTNHRSPFLVQNQPPKIPSDCAYLVKPDLDSGEDLKLALEAVLAHKAAVKLPPTTMPTITKGQAEILRLMAEGLTNEQIATIRYTSKRAVELTVNRLYTALGLPRDDKNLRVLAVRKYRRSEVNV